MSGIKRERKVPEPGSHYDKVWTLARQEDIPFKDAEQVIRLRRAKTVYEMYWKNMAPGKIASLMGLSGPTVTRLRKHWQAHLDEQ